MTAATAITATFVKNVNPDSAGDQKLWRLSDPVPYGWNDEGEARPATSYVVTSAAVAMFSGAETYIFPADADGQIIDWGEMNGSFRGGLDHDEAIENAGWVKA